MKLLLLSCHSVLEYDELRLWSDIGIECYSLGAYTMPGAHEKRPALPQLPYDPKFCEWATLHGKQLIPEMVADMDAIVIMHTPDFLDQNVELLIDCLRTGKRVIWRSIGQSVPWIEHKIRAWRANGMEIVRYSPAEQSIWDFAGEDALIRFGKYAGDFLPWRGGSDAVVTFAQSLVKRADHCGYYSWLAATEGLPRVVYGPDNGELGKDSGGLIVPELIPSVLASAPAVFSAGTYPASYTLSLIEAMMAGTPIVTVGPRLGNGPQYSQQRTYEGDRLLDGCPDIELVHDDMASANGILRELLADHALGESVSEWVRARASVFEAEHIKRLWRQFFKC